MLSAKNGEVGPERFLCLLYRELEVCFGAGAVGDCGLGFGNELYYALRLFTSCSGGFECLDKRRMGDAHDVWLRIDRHDGFPAAWVAITMRRVFVERMVGNRLAGVVRPRELADDESCCDNGWLAMRSPRGSGSQN